ncbi:phage virion morphogenesis protein [Cupriavidus basilensis OR16]|uniref:Phage virion morphogenesis protein n=1 Tax=Cupriavidus basilensis OR16 TaxID=1127483 RepID=H1SDG2_9BURK|nr:phage virion morphogenesis protein [Cupriavidus basilensis]EHP39416.1 phage virion morphogenesis protein [Cupriavidus basilensis OR16]
MLRTTVRTDTLDGAAKRLQQVAADHSPITRQIAGIMLHAVQENFQQGGRPRWAGLKAPRATPERVRRHLKMGRGILASGAWSIKVAGRIAGSMNSHQVLQDTGRLVKSITSYSDANTAVVGTNVVYAAIHNFGGKTKPHVIRPRYKKALSFNGIVRKAVRHPGSDIPARPFLTLTALDEDKILSAVHSYLLGLL